MKKRASEASALTARLQEAHSLMSSGKDQMHEISFALTNTSDKYRSTANVYSEYGSVFGVSKRLIAEISRRVTWQDFIWYLGFYMFLATCAYIVLERFPIGTILGAAWHLLVFLGTQVQSGLDTVWPAEPKLEL